ncbi:MAG: ATP synthase F1 subunit epsilon [Gemmataceae bacterium]
MASKELHCVVVTPERALLDEPADFVALPMYDGELGILPGRAPLVGRLGTGELRIRQGSTTTHFFVDSGFVQVRDNVVTVLTSVAKKASEIYPDAMQNVLNGLLEQLKRTSGVDAQAEVLKSIDSARAQMRVGRKDT